MPSPGSVSAAAPPGWRGKTALFGAFCLFLSAAEYLIPKPLPFMRLGLAMAPLLLASAMFPFRAFLLLAAVKICGQALITGTLFSYVFLFSLAGTLLSALAMYAARRLFGEKIGFAGTGVLGAVVSNAAQLVLARFFVFGKAAWLVAPPFLAAGLVTGAALGFFCEYFSRKSAWYAPVNGGGRGAAGKDGVDGGALRQPGGLSRRSGGSRPETFRRRRAAFMERAFSARDLAATGLLMLAALLFNGSTVLRAAQFLYFVFLVWLSGKRNSLLLTMTVIAGIVAVNLLVPYGKVLFAAGPFKITEGALAAGIHRAATLEALVMLSRFSIRGALRLPGFFGKLLADSFRIFSALQERRNTVDRKNIVSSLDALLFEFGGGISAAGTGEQPAQKTEVRGYVFLAAAAAIAWLPVISRVI